MNSMATPPLHPLAEALRPIFSRVRKSAYAVKRPGGTPAGLPTSCCQEKYYASNALFSAVQ